MSSLKETRDLLLVSCVKGIINANEFAIFYDVNMSKIPLFPYDNYEEFWLDNFIEEECMAEFRVERNDLPVLADAFGIPPVFRWSQRSCLKEWKACVCCLDDLHILVVTVSWYNDLPDLSQKLAWWPLLLETGLTTNMATTLMILTSPSSPVRLCEHMQTQAIKRVRRWITAGISLMALSALFAAHSRISESSTMATKGYIPWSCN